MTPANHWWLMWGTPGQRSSCVHTPETARDAFFEFTITWRLLWLWWLCPLQETWEYFLFVISPPRSGRIFLGFLAAAVTGVEVRGRRGTDVITIRDTNISTLQTILSNIWLAAVDRLSLRSHIGILYTYKMLKKSTFNWKNVVCLHLLINEVHPMLLLNENIDNSIKFLVIFF